MGGGGPFDDPFFQNQFFDDAFQMMSQPQQVEITGDPARLERAKTFINNGLADGSLKPLIAKSFPLDQIVLAHRYLESNQQIGKIVVTL